MLGNEAKIGISGFFGAVLLVVADIGLKGEASAIKTIRDNLAQFFSVENLPLIAVITIIVVIGIGVASCFIFEENSMKKAFYRGASVLAIGMTITPNPQYKPVETSPKSELVQISLQTEDNQPVSQAVLTVWDVNSNKIVAKSKFTGNTFSFYQAPGRYRIYIEVPGYNIEYRVLEVVEGRAPSSLTIRLEKASLVPLFIQRIFK
jgi:hypothetical protein